MQSKLLTLQNGFYLASISPAFKVTVTGSILRYVAPRVAGVAIWAVSIAVLVFIWLSIESVKSGQLFHQQINEGYASQCKQLKPALDGEFCELTCAIDLVEAPELFLEQSKAAIENDLVLEIQAAIDIDNLVAALKNHSCAVREVPVVAAKAEAELDEVAAKSEAIEPVEFTDLGEWWINPRTKKPYSENATTAIARAYQRATAEYRELVG